MISQLEQQLYDLIARRFIAAFYPSCAVSNTTVLEKVGSLEFKATGKQILAQGWREVYANLKKSSKSKDQESIMPQFREGEKGPHDPMIKKKPHRLKLTQKQHYCVQWKRRVKQVDDEDMRELMKDNGIGRLSTRANIIETLSHR